MMYGIYHCYEVNEGKQVRELIAIAEEDIAKKYAEKYDRKILISDPDDPDLGSPDLGSYLHKGHLVAEELPRQLQISDLEVSPWHTETWYDDYERLIENQYFDDYQLAQIQLGFTENLSVEEIKMYADNNFDEYQMREIRIGLSFNGLTMEEVSVYADKSISSDTMSDIREDLSCMMSIEEVCEKYDIGDLDEIGDLET